MEKEQMEQLIEQHIKQLKSKSKDGIGKRIGYEREYILQLYGCLSTKEKQELENMAKREENLITRCRNLDLKLPNKLEQVGIPIYNPDIKGITINEKPKDFEKLNQEINELIKQIDLNCNNGKISIEEANSLKQNISFYYSYFESKVNIMNNENKKESSIIAKNSQYKIRQELEEQMLHFKKLASLKPDVSEITKIICEPREYSNFNLYLENMSNIRYIEQIAKDRIVQLKQEYNQSSGKKKSEIKYQLNKVDYIAEQIDYDRKLDMLKNSNLSHEQYSEQKNELDNNFAISENSYLMSKKLFLAEKFNSGQMYRFEYQQELQKIQEKINLNEIFLSEYEEKKRSCK